MATHNLADHIEPILSKTMAEVVELNCANISKNAPLNRAMHYPQNSNWRMHSV
jgi:hypothetical protein